MSEEQSRMNPARWWQREPVMVVASVQAVIGVLVAFGWQLTDEQIAAILGLSGVLSGWLVTRQQVTPTSKIEALNGAGGVESNPRLSS